MALEKTLAIIKPDAVQRQLIGEIIHRLERAKLKVIALKMVHLNKEQAEGFYAEHQGKHFFDGLIARMTASPVVVLVLEGENAVQNYRQLIGKTNPQEAAIGTIRYDYALDGSDNSVHGSDSVASAEREIAYFFSAQEVY